MAPGCQCDPIHGCTQMEMIEFLFEGLFSFIVGGIGTFGNLAAIAYYRKRRSSLKSTFHGLMTALAVYDLIIIVSLILLISIPKFSCGFKGSSFYQNFAPWILFIGHIGLEGSIYLTIAITIERYLVTCQPMIYRSKWWPTKAFVVPITCFSIIFCIPKLFEVESKTHYQINRLGNFTEHGEILQQCLLPLTTLSQQTQHTSPNGYQRCLTWLKVEFATGNERSVNVPSNCTRSNLGDVIDKLLTKTKITTLVPTQLRQNPCYFQIYIVWLNIIFNAVLPFLVLIILNSYILRHLIINERRGSSRHGRQIPDGRNETLVREPSRLRIHHHPTQMRKRENKVSMAKVSLAIVFVFIICHSIRWIVNIYEFFWVSVSSHYIFISYITTSLLFLYGYNHIHDCRTLIYFRDLEAQTTLNGQFGFKH